MLQEVKSADQRPVKHTTCPQSHVQFDWSFGSSLRVLRRLIPWQPRNRASDKVFPIARYCERSSSAMADETCSDYGPEEEGFYKFLPDDYHVAPRSADY